MADIAKCGGIGCAVKDHCLRYTVKPSTHQAWAGFDTEHRLSIRLRETKPDAPCGGFIHV